MFKILLMSLVVGACSSTPSNIKKENKYCYMWQDVEGNPHRECFDLLATCDINESYLRDKRPWYKVIMSCEYY